MNNLKWKMGNTKFSKKIGYALEGLLHGFVYDKSARTVIIIVFTLILLTFLFVPTILNKSIAIGLTILWLSVELLNTSIESTVDRIGLKYNILSKHAKDLAAAAGLIAEIGVIITVCFMIVHTYREYKIWKDKHDDSIIDYIKWTFHVRYQ